MSLHAWQQLYTILRNMYLLPDLASASYKVCFNCTTVQLMCSSQILLWMPFGKFHLGFGFFTYIVICSYSSCPFSYTLVQGKQIGGMVPDKVHSELFNAKFWLVVPPQWHVSRTSPFCLPNVIPLHFCILQVINNWSWARPGMRLHVLFPPPL